MLNMTVTENKTNLGVFEVISTVKKLGADRKLISSFT